jgi:serine/threonine protein kinase
MSRTAQRMIQFDLQPGERLGGKYVVEEFMGGGVEGEVYKVVEKRTRIHRAAKIFYPRGNEHDRAARSYARKLDRLRTCPLIIQYHHAESLEIQGTPVTALFSDFVDGILLSDFVAAHPGGRLQPFEALHVIYPIVCGLEQIHGAQEYHGDLHDQNILIRPNGIFFDIKIVDFFDHGRSSGAHRRDDIVDVTRLLHTMIGGSRFYARQPAAIKSICLGLRRDRVYAHFPNATRLRKHLEQLDWLDLI